MIPMIHNTTDETLLRTAEAICKVIQPLMTPTCSQHEKSTELIGEVVKKAEAVSFTAGYNACLRFVNKEIERLKSNKITNEDWLVSNSTVYCLNDEGTNRYSFRVESYPYNDNESINLANNIKNALNMHVKLVGMLSLIRDRMSKIAPANMLSDEKVLSMIQETLSEVS